MARAGDRPLGFEGSIFGTGMVLQVNAVGALHATVAPQAKAPPRSRARPGLRRQALAATAITLVSLCSYGPTIHQRGHYSDDFPNRLAVQRSNWWGACQEYRDHNGWIRPVGFAALFAAQQWLWDIPLAQQMVLLGLHVTLCLLAYSLAGRITGDRTVGLVAAAILAAWPSYTGMVVWAAGGFTMLPAYVTLLAALVLYTRHLASPGARGWYLASLGLFAVSVTFHDQHLGAVAAFSVLAVTCSPRERRARALAGTGLFWLAALAMGLVSLLTARTSERPLEPTLTGFATVLASVCWDFVDLSVVQPLSHSLARSGPAESISRMAESDPALLALAVATLVVSTALVLVVCWPAGRSRAGGGAIGRLGGQPLRDNGRLAAVGGIVLLAGLAIMALREGGAISPRHTLLPAIGLSLVLGSAWGMLRARRARIAGAVVLAGLLVGLSVFRLGYAYEWTTRTRVTERVLACLDRLYPVAHGGDLLVIDGVRKYGRGFTDSWGLSGALSLRRGVETRVATCARPEGDRLYANAAWDAAWAIEPASTRFFVWSEQDWSLRPVPFTEFLARHPELGPDHR